MKSEPVEGSGAASFWSSRARSFDAIYDYSTWWDRLLHQPLQRRHDATMAAVRARHAPTLCDVGCGSGRQLAGGLDAGAVRAVGIDLSTEMAALARERCARFGDGGRVEILVGDALRWETAEKFDLVFALGVFDYIRDPKPLLRKMSDLTRDQVLVTFRRVWALRSPFRKLTYAWRGQPIYLYSSGRIRREMSAVGLRQVCVERLTASSYIAKGTVAHAGKP